MKKLILGTLILVVAGGAGALYMRSKTTPAGAPSAGEAAMGPPKTVMVEAGPIDLKVNTNGKAISNLDVEIKSKASGQIVKLPFDQSDTVTSGQLIAELDPVDENRNVSLKEAALLSARARLAQSREQYQLALVSLDTGTSTAEKDLESALIRHRDAKARLERQQDLYDKQLISKEDLDTARSDFATAASALVKAQTGVISARNQIRSVEMRKQDILLSESDVKRAEVDLENAVQRLKECRIYAPRDGVITERKIQVGQIISSGISNVGGGTTLMTLSDLSRIFVNASVDESDIGKIKVDQTAIITADAYPGKRFFGKVVRIAMKGLNTQNVVTFEVKIEVTGEGVKLLRPEMTANVAIQADHRDEALLLPNEVIQFDRKGYFVEVDSKDPTTTTKTKQRIEIGITDGLNTEILAGLEEADEVCVPALTQSKWAQGMAGQGNQGGFGRGMQRATWSLSGAGRGPGGGGGGGRR